MLANPSPFQLAIFDFARSNSAHFAIDAVAGSGKTTTAVELARILDVNRTTLLAFNKAIAEELRQRGLPNAATFHSACLGLLKCAFSVTVDLKKLWRLAKATILASHFDDYYAPCKQLVSLLKQQAVRPGDANLADTIAALCDLHQIASPDAVQLVAYVTAIFTASCAELDSERITVDFDDMLYGMFYRGIPFDLAPNIIVDEAQDTNPLQLAILRLAPPATRIIIVGDPHQAIYAFRGADSAAMPTLISAFDMPTLPLSRNYRSGTAIIAEAQRLVPHITAHDGAPVGAVHREAAGAAAFDTLCTTANFLQGSIAVLCRNNAPLLGIYYTMRKFNIPAVMLGRELGAQLTTLLRSILKTAETYAAAHTLLAQYHASETRKLENRGISTAALDDRMKCLFAIVSNGEANHWSLAKIITDTALAFDDEPSPGKIILSTIHRAKGREWDHVFWHRSDLCTPRDSTPAGMQQQQLNLQYVAITRAKSHLYYC